MGKEKLEIAAGFAAAVLSLVLFGWLANQVWRHETIVFDAAVRNGVHSFASPPLTGFFRVITNFGSELFLIPFGAFVIWRLIEAGRRHAAILFTLAAAGGEVLDYVLKTFFHRARPHVFFGSLPTSYSFPSGHSMLSACFFGTLAAVAAPRLRSGWHKAGIWIAAAAATLLIGLSRIYLGVHYPSDVAAGYAAAIIWVVAIRVGYQIYRSRMKNAIAESAEATRRT